MKIVADENMPGVSALFGHLGEVRLVPGRGLSAAQVADADVLLVRSVTRVDRRLLEGSRVTFVGSATIGTDHVDLDYLARGGIAFANAPGCNAIGVVNYVIATLCRLEPRWREKSLGIIGCGNVGGRLYRVLAGLGVDSLCYDPFLGPGERDNLRDLDEVLAADILCLHTPLTTSGPFPTRHMINREVLANLAPGTLLINAGRGGAVETAALLDELNAARLRAALDVWEQEPAINPALLAAVDQATPHIAGYSLEGRLRGTLMVYQALCRWRGIAVGEEDVDLLASRYEDAGDVPGKAAIPGGGATLNQLVLAAYDPGRDHRDLVAAGRAGGDLGAAFDRLRKGYRKRREFSHYTVTGVASARLRSQLLTLGFHCR